jgi:hypothetical protein
MHLGCSHQDCRLGAQLLIECEADGRWYRRLVCADHVQAPIALREGIFHVVDLKTAEVQSFRADGK